MGLLKQIMSDDGIPLNYHRISSIIINTNQNNLVTVTSYTSPEARQDELKIFAQAEMSLYARIYTQVRWYGHEYDQSMTVDDAYAWLKTVEMIGGGPNPFLGAEDYQEDWDIPDLPEQLDEETTEESTEEGF